VCAAVERRGEYFVAELEFRDVTKQFDDGTVAVRELNLRIEDGEFIVFVGPSGCGKSTSLRLVAGLERITSGELLIDGEVVNHMTPKERDIAMVFQNYALYPHMTVDQNMGFALMLAKVEKPRIIDRVKSAAGVLGLGELLHRRPRELSGGQRQRVAMGRAIVRQPRAFLMDEPLSNLDAKLRVQMRAEVSRLQEELGTTTVYVTHDQVEAMTMGDRVAVMRLGRLQQYDTPEGLYHRPANMFVAGFIGSPPMNLLVGRVVRQGEELVAQFGSNELVVQPEALDAYPRLKDHLDEDVAIGMRPEAFFRADIPDEPGARFRAGVNRVEVLGADALVHLTTDAPAVMSEDVADAFDDEDTFAEYQERQREGLVMVARVDARVAPKRDEMIDVPFATEELHFFDLRSGAALR
jgi:multiple sugar transport system ATP-binding protein